MAVRYKVESKLDLREFNKLIKKLKNLETWEAAAGFKDSDKHPVSGASASWIAEINNFGGVQYSTILNDNVTIPARPFMTYAQEFDEHILRPMIAELITNFIYGNINSQQVLRPLSKKMVHTIQWAMTSEMGYQRNADLTISLKGFNMPLYETGWLADHVHAWVGKS